MRAPKVVTCCRIDAEIGNQFEADHLDTNAQQSHVIVPVLSVLPFDDLEEVLAIAKDSEYGAAA